MVVVGLFGLNFSLTFFFGLSWFTILVYLTNAHTYNQLNTVGLFTKDTQDTAKATVQLRERESETTVVELYFSAYVCVRVCVCTQSGKQCEYTALV